VSRTFEDLQRSGRLTELEQVPALRQRVHEEVRAAIARGSPCVVANLMVNISNFAPTTAKAGLIRPLARECLESDDPLVRWSGIWSLERLGDRPSVRSALLKDYASLLIRPDVSRWWATAWWKDENSKFNRRNAAVTVAGLRADLVALLGKYRITEARSVLLAVIDDDCEWYGGLKATAGNALVAMQDVSVQQP
jgi:hypothetical protein